jgi:threonine dehydrogenase-like Zn-dependent dehydrogenase
MPSLTFVGPRELEWRDDEKPQLASDDAAFVRPIAVATCDLDALIITGGSPFPPPFAIGHEGVAEVVDIGDHVTSVKPGDRVVVPFQVSCGTCGPCLEGRTGNCATVTWQSTYGFGFGGAYSGGFLADLVYVPYADHMLVPVPQGIAPEAAASASDNIPDAYRTVTPLRDQWAGGPVLVVGGAGPGSIGLYAVAHAISLGAERVLYVDDDEQRRAIATKLGAETLGEIPERLNEGFPVTVDASANPRGLELALRATAPDGTCTSTGIYFDASDPPRFPLFEMYVRNTTFVTGRVHARKHIPPILESIESGRFDPTQVTTKVVDWHDAPDALLEFPAWNKLVFTRA